MRNTNNYRNAIMENAREVCRLKEQISETFKTNLMEKCIETLAQNFMFFLISYKLK